MAMSGGIDSSMAALLLHEQGLRSDWSYDEDMGLCHSQEEKERKQAAVA